jgi:heme/copper-type cytochrome/quinol oxidase subunit 3
LGIAIAYAIIFTYVQFCEYKALTFSINDGIYGSLFFMLTGFHGFHVIIGTAFLSVMFIRAFRYKFRVSYVGLECAIWYWHFVDVVWLFL